MKKIPLTIALTASMSFGIALAAEAKHQLHRFRIHLRVVQ